MRYLVALMLLIVACVPIDDPNSNVEYRVGTEGLVVYFGDSPPPKVYEGSELHLYLELRNRGAFDLESGAGTIYLSGFDPGAMDFDGYSNGYASQITPEILGKDPYMMDGGYELLDWGGGEVSVPFGESYKPTIMATSCYQYQTIATPTVCVISDPGSIIKTDVCRPETITLASQGAPVAVTKVEEEIMQQQINFVVTVENVGNGKVINSENMDKCPFNLKHTDINIVEVDMQLSDQGDAVCKPADKKVRLVDGKGIIHCVINVEMETSYTTPLVITLDYGYSSSVTRQLEIVRPPGATS